MRRRAIYPGTFDPITFGHIDIIKRSALIFDEIVVSVAQNAMKQPLFTFDERLAMVREVTHDMERVVVEGFDELIVNYARRKDSSVLIRGLRMISDFEYEFQMALTNYSLAPDIETIFFVPHPQYSYVSSRLIKEAFFLGADLEQFLPECVISALRRKQDARRSSTNK